MAVTVLAVVNAICRESELLITELLGRNDDEDAPTLMMSMRLSDRLNLSKQSKLSLAFLENPNRMVTLKQYAEPEYFNLNLIVSKIKLHPNTRPTSPSSTRNVTTSTATSRDDHLHLAEPGHQMRCHSRRLNATATFWFACCKRNERCPQF
jgi:hypothetical protein